MNNKLLFAILGMFLLIPIVLAVTGNIQTDIFYSSSTSNSLNNVEAILYDCDYNCTNIGSELWTKNSGNSNQMTFEYPYNPSSTASNPDYYAHYVFAECYLPKEYTEWTWGYGESWSYDYYFNKASGCHSPIDSMSVTNDHYVNEPIVISMSSTIEADAHSAFTNLWFEMVPSGYEDYYSAETLVTLEIFDGEDNLIYTDDLTKNILMDTYENVEFSWTPTERGNYTIRLTTDVVDCQCSSSFEHYEEKQIVVWEARPQDECYTLIQDLEATPVFVYAGNVVTILFNKLSNYADGDHEKTPIDTFVTYEITDSEDNLVYSSSEVISANANSVDYQEVTLDWTPSAGGMYNIKVTGVGNSALCYGKTNPEDVEILGFFVNSVLQYDVTFVVTDADTGLAIEDADVDFGILSGETNSLGELTVSVEEGDYDWEVGASGYDSKSGNVYVDEDKTIYVQLNPTSQPAEEYDVTFVVKDSDTSAVISGASVVFDSQTKYTGSLGKVVFSDVDEGSYSWSVGASGYDSKSGSVYVNSDKTITVYLVNSSGNVSVTEVEFVYPTGGEELDDTVKIKWNASNSLGHVLVIDLFYSRNGGSTWKTIATGEVNDGVYSWDTEDVPNDDEYMLKIVARNDSYGDWAVDYTDLFEIDNEDDDTDDNSVGRCVPNWECDYWSPCVNGYKTRTCVDDNNCFFEFDKPLEEMVCSDDVNGVTIGASISSDSDSSWSAMDYLIWFLVAGIILLIVLIILIWVFR